MISNHYKNKRYKREKFIKRHLNGDGKIIDSFIINNGHIKGLERHCLTDTGIIIIYNNTTNLLVSKLIARPNQIRRLYLSVGKEPPASVMRLAAWHESMGYNK